ncbi:MAG: class I SAM-dependent methyltransferase, partial [Flavobacteriales bacterium]
MKQVGNREVLIFDTGTGHRDERTITSFGEEWEKFNAFEEEEIELAGNEYFDIVPDSVLGPDVVALDMGCGSGRWTRYLSPLVGHVEAVDPSDAIFHAAATHGALENVRWNQADVDNIPFADGTFDFVMCLGVLHHVPETEVALKKLVSQLKPGGHLLLYLYYALDGRSSGFHALFRMANVVRRMVSSLPGGMKRTVCDLIAYGVYLPMRSLTRVARSFGGQGWKRIPLSHYHNKSITIMRNDALDRFGTPLEQRFSK